MNGIQSIVAGVDFSDSSASALAEAVRLASSSGAKLDVVHVVTSGFIDRCQDSMEIATDDLLASVRTQLADVVTKVSAGEDVEADLHVVVGHPYIEVTELVKEKGANLLVLGSLGFGAGRHSVGVIAAKCVRRAHCAVLLVRKQHRGAFGKVVACTDFSETSFEAVEKAAHVADSEGAELQVLHVHYPPWLHPTNVIYNLSVMPGEVYQKEYTAKVQKQLDDVVARVAEKFPKLSPCGHLVERETTAYGIIDHLKETGADLAVVGTHGRSRLKDLVLGTTAERIVHDSPCSVLAVRPDGGGGGR